MATLGPDDFAKKISTDPKFIIDLLFVQDVEQELTAKGYTLPPSYLAYITSSLDKIKAYVMDQGHVLEIKAQDIMQPMAALANTRSGGNGAAGTGW